MLAGGRAEHICYFNPSHIWVACYNGDEMALPDNWSFAGLRRGLTLFTADLAWAGDIPVAGGRMPGNGDASIWQDMHRDDAMRSRYGGFDLLELGIVPRERAVLLEFSIHIDSMASRGLILGLLVSRPGVGKRNAGRRSVLGWVNIGDTDETEQRV